MYPKTSRYYGIETATLKVPDGREVVYLKRRFLPAISKASVLTEFVVSEGDRLDNITAKHLGDPEQFWRICDSNDPMNPDDLTAEIGRRLKIPLI